VAYVIALRLSVAPQSRRTVCTRDEATNGKFRPGVNLPTESSEFGYRRPSNVLTLERPGPAARRVAGVRRHSFDHGYMIRSGGGAMTNLVLPAFSMNCGDWLVVTPAEAGFSEEIEGAPLLAVLSTVLLDGGDFREASCVLTIGLVDEDLPRTREVGGGSVAAELIEADEPDRSVRYLLPAPDGRLTLLAEFTMPGGGDPDVRARIEALMASFHWMA
jgi:hypothetical protein